MSGAARPALWVGDNVIDRENEAESDEELSVILVVELALKREYRLHWPWDDRR